MCKPPSSCCCLGAHWPCLLHILYFAASVARDICPLYAAYRLDWIVLFMCRQPSSCCWLGPHWLQLRRQSTGLPTRLRTQRRRCCSNCTFKLLTAAASSDPCGLRPNWMRCPLNGPWRRQASRPHSLATRNGRCCLHTLL